MHRPTPKRFALSLLLAAAFAHHAYAEDAQSPVPADPTAASAEILARMSGLQANINLLELQVKEAKLRAELAGLNAPPVSPADPKISAAPIVTSTVPGAVPLPGSDMPVVESVRGSGDTLVATIVAPGGTTVPATVGTVLPNGWRVTAIDNFGVAVARPDGQPGRLAFGTGRPASDLPQGGSFTRLPQ